MFFRFTATLVLIIAVSLAGVAMEKRSLAVKRSISLQHYRLQQLLEKRTQLRLDVELRGAPSRLIEQIERGELSLQSPQKPVHTAERTAPLLQWQSNVVQPAHH